MTNILLASVSVRDSSLVLLTPNSVFFLYLKNLLAYWYNFIGKKMTISCWKFVYIIQIPCWLNRLDGLCILLTHLMLTTVLWGDFIITPILKIQTVTEGLSDLPTG